LNNELSWVLDSGFTPADLKCKTHAVLILHEFYSVTQTHRAGSDLRDLLLLVSPDLFCVEPSNQGFDLSIIHLEVGLVLDSSLVKFFLHSNLSDGLVCTVIELSDLKIRHLSV
jgi:hypothetical protein